FEHSPGPLVAKKKNTVIEGIHGDYALTIVQTSSRNAGLTLRELLLRTNMRSLDLTQFVFELLMPNEFFERSFMARSCFMGGRLTEDANDDTVLLEGMNEVGEFSSLLMHRSNHGIRSYYRRFEDSPLDHEPSDWKCPAVMEESVYKKAMDLEWFDTIYKFDSLTLS
ncbi:hypothetical protein OAS39_08475, partial [Pirellulales bacterium]|nr:hypothetical protein [Pirellulales bacterium]